MPRFLPLLLGLTALGACTVGPDYRRPEVAVSDQWVEPAAPGAVDTQWWTQFGDARLSALIARAIAASPDLKDADARLAEARANRDAARGGTLPQVQAKGSATENVLSENGQLPIQRIPGFNRDFGLFDLGFDASWELDFWGHGRRQVEAANARAEAAEAARRDTMLTLIAEIARNYIDLRAAQADIASGEATAKSDADLARLTRLRFQAGEADAIEAGRADAAARASAAAIADARSRAAAAAYRIATLVGVVPERIVPELRTPAPLPASPDTILTGVRSDLLTRRPDVRRAERELAAASADIGVATADLFPRFSLAGSLGQQARDPGDLGSSDSTRLQIGPSFSWPIFSAGTIRARIRAADARAQGAEARYEKAVIGALSDSEAAINRFLNARAALIEAEASLAHEQAAFALAQARTERGEDDRLALARAQQARTAAERRRDSAAAAKAQAAIALYKALGGGWSG